MTNPALYLGVDVGAERVHCAALAESGRVARLWQVSRADIGRLGEELGAATAVAVDAPQHPSKLPHADDESLSPKFRLARCAEVALGREYGSWVPWVSPATRPATGWMATGFAVYAALANTDVPVLEVYPYAGFRELARGARLPRKTTGAGKQARAKLLATAETDPKWLPGLSHDDLDALLAALVALHYTQGRARRVGCDHDESAIWLPAPPGGC